MSVVPELLSVIDFGLLIAEDIVVIGNCNFQKRFFGKLSKSGVVQGLFTEPHKVLANGAEWWRFCALETGQKRQSSPFSFPMQILLIYCAK